MADSTEKTANASAALDPNDGSNNVFVEDDELPNLDSNNVFVGDDKLSSDGSKSVFIGDHDSPDDGGNSVFIGERDLPNNGSNSVFIGEPEFPNDDSNSVFIGENGSPNDGGNSVFIGDRDLPNDGSNSGFIGEHNFPIDLAHYDNDNSFDAVSEEVTGMQDHDELDARPRKLPKITDRGGGIAFRVNEWQPVSEEQAYKLERSTDCIIMAVSGPPNTARVGRIVWFGCTRAVAVKQSSYFRQKFDDAALNGPNAPVQRIVNVRDTNMADFTLVMRYFHTENLLDDHGQMPSSLQLCRLWVLGARFGAAKLQNYAIREIEKYQTNIIQLHCHDFVYKNTLPGSPLRGLFAHYVAFKLHPKDLFEDARRRPAFYPWGLLLDVAVFAKARVPPQPAHDIEYYTVREA